MLEVAQTFLTKYSGLYIEPHINQYHLYHYGVSIFDTSCFKASVKIEHTVKNTM